MDSLHPRTVTMRTETLNSLFTFSQTPHLPGLSRSTVFPGVLTPMTYRNEHAEHTASAGTSQGGAVSIHHVLLSGETRPAALAVMPAWLPYIPRHTSYTSYLVRGISNPALYRITHNSLHKESQFQFYDDFRKHQTSPVEPKCPRLSFEQAYEPPLNNFQPLTATGCSSLPISNIPQTLCSYPCATPPCLSLPHGRPMTGRQPGMATTGHKVRLKRPPHRNDL